MTIKQITLLPLGTCSADQNKYQLYSSYLLLIETMNDTYQFIFDTGSKRCCNPCWVDFNKLKIIFISHFHMDHTLYLNKLMRLLSNSTIVDPPTIFMHDLTWKILQKIIKVLDLRGNALKLFRLHPKKIIHKNVKIETIKLPVRKSITDQFDQILELPLIPFYREEKVDFIMKISITNAMHSKECIAYRLDLFNEEGSKSVLSFVYSPDTRYNSNYLTNFAHNIDFWLLDTTFNNDYIEKHKNNMSKLHSSPRYSAELCEKAKSKNYLVAHYFWKRFAKSYSDASEQIKIQTENRFSGNIIVLEDLNPIVLYHDI